MTNDAHIDGEGAGRILSLVYPGARVRVEEKTNGVSPLDAPHVPAGGSTSIFERARRYVEQMDPAISGQGGHLATWRVAQVLIKGFDLARADADALLREYNERCQPPWSGRELAHKLDDAEKRSRMPRGFLSEGDRDRRPGSWREHASPEWDAAPPDEGNRSEATPDLGVSNQAAAPRIEWLDSADLSKLSLEYVERLDDGREAAVSTGWSQIDEQLDGGFWPGLHVICGATGAMKTQLALTSAINAARAGTPAVVVALEQRRHAWSARARAEMAGVSWSRTIRGRMSDDDRARYNAAAWPELLYLIPGEPYRFPIDAVCGVAAELRRRHPTGQGLIIVDYCQLTGDLGATDETRQRVMRAALAAQRAAHQHDLAVVLLSSVAREHYAKLADLPSKGSMLVTLDTERGPVRELRGAHALIGLGKESGEIEYSAESVTAVARGPHPDIQGASVVVAATAKRRCGTESWCAFRAEHGRLFEAHDYRLSAGQDGAEDAARDAERQRVDGEIDSAIVKALTERPGGLSARALRDPLHGIAGVERINERLAHLTEVSGVVAAVTRAGRGGGRLYRLASADGDPES